MSMYVCSSFLTRMAMRYADASMLTSFSFDSNATVVGAFTQPDTYMNVFEEVTKYNVQLNVVERLWAVSSTSTPERMVSKTSPS